MLSTITVHLLNLRTLLKCTSCNQIRATHMDITTATSTRLTGLDIEQRIIQSIESGVFTRGMQLPSVREMADELGVNKNTVVRIYRSLHRQGYLNVVQGSGTYVRDESMSQSDPESLPHIERAAAYARTNGAQENVTWQNQIVDALRLARAQGIEQETAKHAALDALHQVYENNQRSLIFVECNQYDIDSLSNILAKAIGQPLQGICINDFLANPEEYVAKSDLIITTFYHLNEIEPLVNALDNNKFVAVHAMPTQDALLEIARLQVPVLGVVADQPRALDNVIHIVKTYQHTATIMSSSLEDGVRLQNLLDKADAIAVTQSRYPGLMKHNPQIPVVPLSLTISQESINHLQEHLALLSQAN